MGRVTTHVLDTARGRPAAGIRVTLTREGRRLAEAVTNDDGRTDVPLLSGVLETGRYELVFAVGDYLRSHGHPSDTLLFLDEIPIRFGISEPDSHYHVPLLLQPFGYSTYRGS